MLEVITRNLIDVYGSYFQGNIPVDKFNTAKQYFAYEVDYNEVLYYKDTTMFGGAKDGVVITKDGFYSKDYSNISSFKFADVTQVGLTPKQSVVIYDNNNVQKKISAGLDKELLITLVNELVEKYKSGNPHNVSNNSFQNMNYANQCNNGMGQQGQFNNVMGQQGQFNNGMGQQGQFNNVMGQQGQFNNVMGQQGQFNNGMGQQGQFNNGIDQQNQFINAGQQMAQECYEEQVELNTAPKDEKFLIEDERFKAEGININEFIITSGGGYYFKCVNGRIVGARKGEFGTFKMY